MAEWTEAELAAHEAQSYVMLAFQLNEAVSDVRAIDVNIMESWLLCGTAHYKARDFSLTIDRLCRERLVVRQSLPGRPSQLRPILGKAVASAVTEQEWSDLIEQLNSATDSNWLSELKDNLRTTGNWEILELPDALDVNVECAHAVRQAPEADRPRIREASGAVVFAMTLAYALVDAARQNGPARRINRIDDLDVPLIPGSIQSEAPPQRAIVSIKPPQITIDGDAYALTEDQAIYLRALIDSGDWMSAAEFRNRCPEVGENARPDRWCNKLEQAVKDCIETDRKRGSRWKPPVT